MRVGEVVWPLTQVVGIARRHLQEFQQVRRCPSKKIRAQRPRWKPPDTGWVKANFDGVIFEDISAAGSGVAVRNEHGEIVAAMAEKILLPNSVFTLRPWQQDVWFCLFRNLAFVMWSLRVIQSLPFKLFVIDFYSFILLSYHS